MKWQSETMIPYSQLPETIINQFCNGCGASKGRFRPPHYALFKHQCCSHDYAYVVGGSLWDKLKADWNLRSRIKNKTKKASIKVLRNNLYINDAYLPDWIIRQIYYIWASLYFIGVVFGGNSSFRFSKTKIYPVII